MLLRYAFTAVLVLSTQVAQATDEWKVGFSRVVITPDEPVWLCGYVDRNRPADGKVHDLWAKAAAFESADGTRLVLVTLDLGSVNPHTTAAVAAAAEARFNLPRANLVLNCSHTHCAPEIAEERRVFHNLSDAEEAKLSRYIEQLDAKLIELVGAAIADLRPALLSVSRSRADFAFNRRHPSGVDVNGPTDREVPVLRVTDLDGKLRGLLFGYACHNTTLNFQLFCGDYAGFAQYALEAAHPEVQAMFVMGCGGDQNPQPRHGPSGLEHARKHGQELAEAVDRGLAGPQTPVHGALRVAFDVATLPIEPLPRLEDLRSEAQSKSTPTGRKAKYLLDMIESGKEVPLFESCPLHVARFGDDLLLILISGEAVVDYSLLCKARYAGPTVWVAGYCDDVFAYLPSRRVLLEGGYEGRTGIVHQLTASPFLPNVEQRVMECLDKLVAQVSDKTSNARDDKP